MHQLPNIAAHAVQRSGHYAARVSHLEGGGAVEGAGSCMVKTKPQTHTTRQPGRQMPPVVMQWPWGNPQDAAVQQQAGGTFMRKTKDWSSWVW